MEEQQLNNKIKHATRWSAFSEILTKLLAPFISMVLARVLAPEAFGIVVTLSIVISFAELFTDAGFQKYLVQHDFKDDIDREESTNVAFWTNFVLSLFLWLVICIFNEPISSFVGCPGLGHVLIVACLAIPLEAFSSIQLALFRRDLDFKTLFKVRMISSLVPLFCTLPLAFIFRNYWALVIGTLAQHLLLVLLLSLYSSWKPRLFYSFAKFKQMFSFTAWSMLEAFSIWLTNYVDVFFVGTLLSTYYLGLYRTSINIVAQIIALLTGFITPVLFSSLSKVQNDDAKFKSIFFTFQRYVALIVLPIGVGIFVYRDFVTSVLLGSQWGETAGFIGLWGITSAITVVLSYYSSEVYRAKGKPKISVLAQWLHIIVLVPVVYVASKYDYQTLYVARSLVRFEGILVDLLLMSFVFHISGLQLVRNITHFALASLIMGICGYFLVQYLPNITLQAVSILACMIVYIIVLSIFPSERELFKTMLKPYLVRFIYPNKRV